MSSRIGIVSPDLCFDLKAHANQIQDQIFWFQEIEACFAYLLTHKLDKIFFNNKQASSLSHFKIYINLIKQLNPQTEILVKPEQYFSEKAIFENKKFFIFPTLAEIFKNGNLKSMFQPIVSQSNIYAFECLSRLYYKNTSFAPDFIFSYAQEKLMLPNYDKICLMKALAHIPQSSPIPVFMNVRPQTLVSNLFAEWFKAQLKKNQIDPQRIVLEITEHFCVYSEQDLVQACTQLRKQQIRFALDDFGSGVSNLSMLELIEPEFIKISGRFTSSSHKNLTKQKIINNILDLCNLFSIKAIVENVESKEEAEFITKIGAPLAQGFYFYKPMDTSSLAQLLQTKK